MPVPLGAPGLIVFSGVCVGRGYVNDPERTRLIFAADPHREGQRICRTGDYGRWLPDGTLDFLGRRDNQVKIRGFRIEIGEIENALLRVPGVRDGAAVVAEGADRSKHLVAFYSGPGPLEADVLRQRLAEALPEYMVPSVLHWRDSLPLTPNGKIDRTTLTALAGELDAGEEAYDAPRHADRAAAGGRMGEGARHPAGPDRAAGPLLRPGRHVAVGGEAGDRPEPCGVPQGRHPSPGPRRSGRDGRRQVRAALRACCSPCRNRTVRRRAPWCASPTPAATR